MNTHYSNHHNTPKYIHLHSIVYSFHNCKALTHEYYRLARHRKHRKDYRFAYACYTCRKSIKIYAFLQINLDCR